MISRVLAVAWLTGLWVLLWRDASIPNILGGLVIGGLCVLLSPGRPGAIEHRIRPLAFLKFLGVFAVKLVEANIVLAREVVTPENHIKTGIVAVPIPGASDLVLTIVANAVSLTPGTLTLDTRLEPEPTVYVHVLHLHDLDRARAEVVEIADLVQAALPRRTAAVEETA